MKMKKRVVSTLLATVVTLGASTGSFAAHLDIMNKQTNQVKSLNQYIFDNQTYSDLLFNSSKYLIEVGDKFYQASDVVAITTNNPNITKQQLEQAVTALPPVNNNQGELKVESVSAINANEIKVTFNKELDKASAENASNYTISVNGSLYSPGGGNAIKAKLQDDKKTVLLYNQTGTTTLNSILANGESYKVDAEDILDTAFNKVVEYKGSYKVFEDKVSPSIVSATVQSDDTIRLVFNEPVTNTMVVKVDGTTINNTGTVSVSEEAGKYYVKTSPLTGNLKNVGNHNLQVYNATDVAGNTTSLIQKTIVVSDDTTAPTVESISAKNSNTFKVKFSERITGLSSSNLEIRKGTYTFPSGRISGITLDPQDSTNTTYLVSLNAADSSNPLYATGENSATLSVTLKGYKDNAALIGDEYTGTVKLSKDTTAPVIKSEKLNKTSGNRYLEITFNEELSSADDNKISVTKDGVIETVSGASVGGSNNDTLIIDMGSGNVTDGTYNVTLAKGAVEDTSNNKNEAVSTTIVKDVATSSPLTIVADSTLIGTIAASEAGIATGDTNIITVNYGEKMTNSAINLANYKLDGLALPAGTTVGFSSSSKDIVKITLPKETVAIENSDKLLDISKDIKSDAGKTVMNSDKSAISVVVKGFKDNVKPTLKSGKFVITNNSQTTTNRVKLKFDEDMSFSNTAGERDDFKVTVGSTEIPVTQIYDATPGNDEVVLVLGSNVNVNQALKVEVVEAGINNTQIDVQDANGNDLNEGTVIDVTEKDLDTAFDTAAPSITGVTDGQQVVAGGSVTPSTTDTDIASTVLTKDGATVAGYSLGSAVSGAGTYVLTVTDNAGNVTEINFTIAADTAAPTFTTVTMASDNSDTTVAKVGDTVKLTIVASEDISSPTVTIDGNAATVTNAGDSDAKTWEATYTMQSGDTEGALAFTLDADDLAGNSATQVTAVTGGSAVTFDETAPTASVDGTATNSATTFTVTPSETAAVAITAQSITTETASVSGNAFTVTNGGATSGDTITFTVTDTAGNITTYQATFTTSWAIAAQ